ncbi:MAG: sterol desaturase family protein [Candidatus Elarobacter sp.]
MLTTFLRHGSNAVLIALALALVAVFASGRLAVAPFGILLGVLMFFVSEYTTHRFLLHAPPVQNAFVRRLQDRLHYDHHLTPMRLDLLFLPLWFALPVVALTTAIYAAITRSAGLTLSLLLGSVLGLLYYEWVHYVAHLKFFVPKTRFGRWIKKHHLWHHYKNERLWFGVTNPSMDWVGRTWARVEAVERSDRTRVLFPE